MSRYTSSFDFSVGLHKHGSVPLIFLHLSLFVSILLPKPVVENINSSVVDLLPTMEAATHTQGTHSGWEGMVRVMEEHFVPAVFPSMNNCHDGHEMWMVPRSVLANKLLPRVRVVEVRDEHPCCRITSTSEASNNEKEGKTVIENVVAKEKDKNPIHGLKHMMLHPLREQSPVKLLVAFSASTFIWIIIVPLHRKEATGVIETTEMDKWHEDATGKDQSPGMKKLSFLWMPRPLHKRVLKFLRIPPKLSLVKQVISA